MGDPRNKEIDLYLKQVRSRLRGMQEDEISEIVQELRSHIIDCAGGRGSVSDTSLASAMESLGRPEEIAADYMAEYLITRAQATRAPWLVLRAVLHWANVSLGGALVLILSIFGYFLGAIFLLCAMLKPFDPKGVGLWIKHPFSLSLLVGAQDQGPQARELLGWWIIPIGIVAGAGLLLLTTRVVLWIILRFHRSHRRNSAQ